ncbi:uncharacterized protein [Bemisia tabaci]|uniref:uncharacterized protein isoform X2 n=1 Tax=Bemisia tabaci TaxID=7038 RepID=UPI003B28C9BA
MCSPSPNREKLAASAMPKAEFSSFTTGLLQTFESHKSIFFWSPTFDKAVRKDGKCSPCTRTVPEFTDHHFITND